MENYKLAKYALPFLSELIKNNFILGRTYLYQYKNELLSENELYSFTKENLFNKKIIDLLIIILTYLDEIYQDDDIWFYLVECIGEIIHNNYIIKDINGESFKNIYLFYFRIYNKFEDD